MRKDCYYIDTETCGFHGLPVLIQYAYEDGPIVLFEPWRQPVRETLELIERFCASTCVFFNASFDWFQLCKLYTTWKLLPLDEVPLYIAVEQIAQAEKDARDGQCLKPKDTLCLMLHSRKGEFQTLMARHDIRLNKIPTAIAQNLANVLESTIEFDDILFSNQSDPNAPRWKVYDRMIRGKKDEVDPEYKDVVLKFKQNRGLKQLARHCLGLDPEFHSFKDVYPKREAKLYELGYIPYALGVSSPESGWEVDGKFTWPRFIKDDVRFWTTNEDARRYATDDVKYTRMLDEYFGYPESGDDDSTLACMVASVRWHGYELDVPALQELLIEAQEALANAPININSPREVKSYIREVLADCEARLIDTSTKRAHLEKVRDYAVKREDLDPEIGRDIPCKACVGADPKCARCEGTGLEPGGEVCIRCDGEGCPRCEGRGFLLLGKTPAAERAGAVLDWRFTAKEIELYQKLIAAGRFHAAFNVIGTLSSRMSGTAGLNAQAIKNDKRVRTAFPLKWTGMQLSGGDFDGFEVTLAEAVFRDETLRQHLLAGRSIHTSMAQALYPDKTEQQILMSKQHKDGGDIDMYTRGKQAVFALLYGGDENTINKKLSIPIGIARQAMADFQALYPGIKISRERIAQSLTALTQAEGIGSKISYADPQDAIVTFLGFPRYFTLENKIIAALYSLVSSEDQYFVKKLLNDGHGGLIEEGHVIRRDRKQTWTGAARSAVYGAAFNIQSSNIRAANNHLIQSPGAQITKRLQRRIWDHQPVGVSDWVVAPMNIHDEVLVVIKPEEVNAVAITVSEVVESFRPQVPLIGMDWARDMKSWGEKGKKDLGINPTGIKVCLRDDVYVPVTTLEDLAALDEEPLYKDPEESVIPNDWI